MQLNQLKRGKNHWCGPAVMSFITGLTTDEAAALYRHQNPGRNATGIGEGALRKMLRTCGYWVTTHERHDRSSSRPTLAQWLRRTKDIRKSGRVFLIISGNHWQLVTGQRYACGIVKDIVSIKHPKVRRRARVALVWEVEQLTDAQTRTEEVRQMLSQKKKKRQKTNKSRANARSLASQYDIEIEVENYQAGYQSIYLWPPSWVQDARENGIIDYTGIAYDWEDAYMCVDRLTREMEEYRR